MIVIRNLDCLRYIQNECTPGDVKHDVIFADPPDNIGLSYDGHKDSMDSSDYYEWCYKFVTEGMSIVKKGMWISFNAKHTIMMVNIIEQGGDVEWVLTPCVQTITFGQQKNKPGKLTNNFRQLWYLSWGEPNFFEVREQSWRQLNGDKRADPRGKLVSDVFDFPRVTGNSKQRRKWHPTQLNEKLVERCLLLTTQPGDHVLDIFAGTGTTGRVCRSIGRRCTLIEKSEFYCDKMREEFFGADGLGIQESVDSAAMPSV